MCLICAAPCMSLQNYNSWRSAPTSVTGVAPRRSFLPVPFVAGLASLLPMPGHAAIPTYDEYLGGQGSVARTGVPPPASKTSSTQAPKAGVMSVGSVSELSDAIVEARTALAGLSSYIDRQDWDGILARVKEPALARVQKPIFGASKGVVSSLPYLEGDWEDASQALGNLRDFAFENRVIFFNSADKSEVEKLDSETGYSKKFDLTEPRALLKETDSYLGSLLTKISKSEAQ